MKQKHLTPAAAATRNAFGAAERPTDSTLQQVTITFRGTDGKDVTETLNLHGSILSKIADGVKAASKLDTHWKANAEPIIFEFYGEDPFDGCESAEMNKKFRASVELQKMYAVFQTRHPEWSTAQKWLGESKAGGTEGDKSKGAYNDLIVKIRRTANAQALRVVEYYVEDHAADKTDAQREQAGALEEMTECLKDWSAKIETKRGVYKLTAETDILQYGCDALREAIKKAKAYRAKKNPTSTLDLAKPAKAKAKANGAGKPAAPRDQSEKKAGQITVLTGAAAAAVVGATE